MEYILNYTRSGEREHKVILGGKTYGARHDFMDGNWVDANAIHEKILSDFGYKQGDADKKGHLRMFEWVGGELFWQDGMSLWKAMMTTWRLYAIERNYALLGNGMTAHELPRPIQEEDIVFSTRVKMTKGESFAEQTLKFQGKDVHLKITLPDMECDAFPDIGEHENPAIRLGVFAWLANEYGKDKKIMKVLKPILGFFDEKDTSFFPVNFSNLMAVEKGMPRTTITDGNSIMFYPGIKQ